MIVTHLNIQNFLRFHDLTIDMDGQKPRLVLLVGTNGSGKSSVLSLFNLLKWRNKDLVKPGIAPKLETDFGRDRVNPPEYRVRFENLVGETFEQGTDTTFEQKERYNLASSLYGRSSMINVSRLASYKAPTDEELKNDYDMSKTMIDVDNRFTHDLAYTLQEIVQESFTKRDGSRQFLEDLLSRINDSLQRIFDKPLCIQIERLGGGIGLDPIEIRIKKGDFVFGYERLSQGEKNVLNIVFNLWRRAQLFPDAIYYLDELDQHLERKIQYNFLKEIVEVWLPQNSQLWTASHSLGFMEYASDYDQGVIIDLDDRDYDLPQILKPQYKITASTASVAVDVVSLSKLLPDHQVLCVEGKDSTYYGLMDLPLKIIASRHNKHDVYNTATGQIEQFLGLIDRDFLTDDEIELLEEHYPRLAVLRYYSIENYLFHPDNLAEAGYVEASEIDKLKQELVASFGDESYSHILVIEKTRSSQQFLVKAIGEKALKNFIEGSITLKALIQSQDFEEVWKVVKAKDYFHKLTNYQYQQVDKSKLAQTDWISSKINALLLRFDRQ